MKYEVDVDTVEEATIQYTAKVEAESKEDAIKKVIAAISEDGSAFNKYECIQTRVIDTEKIDAYSETVEWEEGQSPEWVAREFDDSKPRIAIIIEKGTPKYVFASQYKVGEFEADVGIINFDTGGVEADNEFWSLQQDDSMKLVYEREPEE